MLTMQRALLMVAFVLVGLAAGVVSQARVRELEASHAARVRELEASQAARIRELEAALATSRSPDAARLAARQAADAAEAWRRETMLRLYANMTDDDWDTAARWKRYADPYAPGRTCATGAARAAVEDDRIALLRSAALALPPLSNASLTALLGLHSFHSTGLEGNTLTLPETLLTISGKPMLPGLDARVDPTPLMSASASEVMDSARLWSALRLGHASSDDRHVGRLDIAALTVERLVDMNSAIIRGSRTPFGLRRHSVGVGHKRVMLPMADEVPVLVDEYITWLTAEVKLMDSVGNDWEARAVALACDAHTRFVFVHPFSDGSGRLARTLSGLVLQRFGLSPPLFTRQARAEYMDAVSSATIDRDYAPLSALHVHAVRRSLEAHVCVALGEHGADAVAAVLASKRLQSALVGLNCTAAFSAR